MMYARSVEAGNAGPVEELLLLQPGNKKRRSAVRSVVSGTGNLPYCFASQLRLVFSGLGEFGGDFPGHGLL